MPGFSAGLTDPPQPPPDPNASNGGLGHQGGPCIATLCHPHSIRVVLAPHGTARRTIRFYAGVRPDYSCPGDPSPYPPGSYFMEVFSPLPTDGPPQKLSIPATITPK
jgi:hypothetical protein